MTNIKADDTNRNQLFDKLEIDSVLYQTYLLHF